MTGDMDTCPIDMSDEDILEAMRSIPGYLDITPSDFKEIYLSAYRFAVRASGSRFVPGIS